MKEIFLVFCFLFISLSKSYGDVESVLRKSRGLKIISAEILKQKPISKPAGVWFDLLHFIGKRNYCLLYKTPFKEDLGILKLVLKKASKCRIDEVFWYQGEIIDLVIITEPKLKISYNLEGKASKHELHLINKLNDGLYKLFDAPQKAKSLKGLHLLE